MTNDQPTSEQSAVVVPTLPDRATELMAALGDNVEQVAASLQAAGVTGERGHCGTCPIAMYLLKSDLGLHYVDVYSDVVTLWFTNEDGADDREHVALPGPCRRFVSAFDHGAFTHLLAAGAA